MLESDEPRPQYLYRASTGNGKASSAAIQRQSGMRLRIKNDRSRR